MYAEAKKSVGFQEVNAPELGRLKMATERVAKTTTIVKEFLYRFDGPQSQQADGCPPSPPESYRNDIESLFAQIERLEDAARLLERIG